MIVLLLILFVLENDLFKVLKTIDVPNHGDFFYSINNICM